MNSIGVPVYKVYTADTTVYARWSEASTITFDLNYAEQPAEKQTKKTVNGYVIPEMPADPVRTGYTFDGWYTAAEGGDKVTIEKRYGKDTTLYAHWTPVTEPTPEPTEPTE